MASTLDGWPTRCATSQPDGSSGAAGKTGKAGSTGSTGSAGSGGKGTPGAAGSTGAGGAPGFGLGCSHSGYERVIWDPSAKKFVPVCKNDAPTGGKSGRIALAPNTSTIYAVDLNYSDLGNVMVAGGGGYWIISSDIRAGQTANSNGLADVHLLHMPSLTTLPPDHDLMLVSDTQNDRAPHLAAYGTGQLLSAWEESTATGDFAQSDKNRQMYLQILDSTTGAAPAGSTATSAGPLKLTPNVLGSRYRTSAPSPTAAPPIRPRAARRPRSRSSASSAASRSRGGALASARVEAPPGPTNGPTRSRGGYRLPPRCAL